MQRGQASADYIGIVAIVALVLTAAGAVAAPDLPGTVARQVRVALCIVGGDVCRASDARRAGLEPCVTRVREGANRTRVNVTIVSYGTGKAFAVERRSDGSARVAIASHDDGGLVAGVGVKLGPHLDVGGEVSGALGWSSGYAWEFPDEAALARFLGGVRQAPGVIGWDLLRKGAGTPTERFSAATGSTGAQAGARILGLKQPLGTAGGRGAIGRRARRGQTTWYFDARHDGPSLFGGILPELQLRPGAAYVLELRDRPRRLRLATSLPDGVELEARLDLTRPANAAVARELLSRPTPARARALGRHLAEHGTVERRVYRVRTLASDPDLALKLGVAGVEHGGTAQERTLVAAEVLRPGSAARRADCLGL